MENGWTTRQKWQKDAVDDWAFRLPYVQETVQSCSRQKEDLDDQKQTKSGMSKKREHRCQSYGKNFRRLVSKAKLGAKRIKV
jgi:hypothetical protein